MANIATAATFGTPQTADTGDLSASELYDALEHWISAKSVYGRGRTESATQFKAVANRQIRRIRQELSDRCLPRERPDWLTYAEQAQADALDERETLSDVRYGGCQ